MKPAPRLLLLCSLALLTRLPAATDVRVDFTLNTTDSSGAPIQQSRSYYVYRPDGLSKATPVPMVLHMAAGAGDVATFLHRKADQAGFVVVSCEFTGNSDGGSWVNDPWILRAAYRVRITTTFRKLPLPPRMMFALGIKLVFDELAVSSKLFPVTSASPRVTDNGCVELF